MFDDDLSRSGLGKSRMFSANKIWMKDSYYEIPFFLDVYTGFQC